MSSELFSVSEQQPVSAPYNNPGPELCLHFFLYRSAACILLFYGFSQLVSFLKLRLSVYVAHISIASRKDMAEVLPPQMLHQMIIIKDYVFKSVSFTAG